MPTAVMLIEAGSNLRLFSSPDALSLRNKIEAKARCNAEQFIMYIGV